MAEEINNLSVKSINQYPPARKAFSEQVIVFSSILILTFLLTELNVD